MYEVQIEAFFHAAHAIRMPNGQMEDVHWHRWRVQALFCGEQLNAQGVLVDFVAAHQRLVEVVAPLEGRQLNQCTCFADVPASTENVARCIFERLNQSAWQPGSLQRVRVHESPGCHASFSRS